jgi:hypothetical protein
MQKRMQGRNIFFRVPLPKEYSLAHKLFDNPWIIWNRTRGDKEKYYSGCYLNIVGDKRLTKDLAEYISSSEENSMTCVRDLFEANETILRCYQNQKTLELYDPTLKPKLRIIHL